MINTYLIQQYPNMPMAYVYSQKAPPQNEAVISQIFHESFPILNIAVLEGNPAKDKAQSQDNAHENERPMSSEKDAEDTQDQEDQSQEESLQDSQNQTEEQIKEDELEKEDDYQIAQPFTQSGAVILNKQEMNLKFEHLPEDAKLWIEEDGEKRNVELDQKELSIAFNTDLVKAYIVDGKGNVLRKWSILCLEEEDGSIKDLILEQEDSNSSLEQQESLQDSSTSLEENSQNDSSMDSSEPNGEQQPNEEEQSEESEEPLTEDPLLQEEVTPPQPEQPPEQQPQENPNLSQNRPAPQEEVARPNPIVPNRYQPSQSHEIPVVNQEECKIELQTNQKTFSSGQKVFAQNLADVKLVANKGTILKVEVISQDTKQTYASLQEAAKSEQSGTFEVKATVLDQNLQEQQANWTVIQVGGTIATSTTTQGKQVDVVYQMDEQGQLSAQRKSHNQTIQLYRKFEPLKDKNIQSGEQLRLYLDKEPGNYQVQINGKPAEAQMEKDELGQPYIPIEAKTGSNTIQLFKDGQELFSQEIFANAQKHFKGYLIAAASVLVAFAIAFTVYKRRGQVSV